MDEDQIHFEVFARRNEAASMALELATEDRAKAMELLDPLRRALDQVVEGDLGAALEVDFQVKRRIGTRRGLRFFLVPLALLQRDLRERATGMRQGDFYSRYANPTVRAFEDAVAELEGAEEALAFGSGMGAVASTILALCSAGPEATRRTWVASWVAGATSRNAAPTSAPINRPER